MARMAACPFYGILLGTEAALQSVIKVTIVTIPILPRRIPSRTIGWPTKVVEIPARPFGKAKRPRRFSRCKTRTRLRRRRRVSVMAALRRRGLKYLKLVVTPLQMSRPGPLPRPRDTTSAVRRETSPSKALAVRRPTRPILKAVHNSPFSVSTAIRPLPLAIARPPEGSRPLFIPAAIMAKVRRPVS